MMKIILLCVLLLLVSCKNGKEAITNPGGLGDGEANLFSSTLDGFGGTLDDLVAAATKKSAEDNVITKELKECTINANEIETAEKNPLARKDWTMILDGNKCPIQTKTKVDFTKSTLASTFGIHGLFESTLITVNPEFAKVASITGFYFSGIYDYLLKDLGPTVVEKQSFNATGRLKRNDGQTAEIEIFSDISRSESGVTSGFVANFKFKSFKTSLYFSGSRLKTGEAKEIYKLNNTEITNTEFLLYLKKLSFVGWLPRAFLFN